jgi:hypothetical protein
MSGNTFNLKETVKFIQICRDTGLVPLLLGHTGIGKTQVVEQCGKAEDKDVIVVHVAQLEPSDFIGLYKEREGRTYNCPPNWLPLAGAKVREFDKAKAKSSLVDYLESATINPNGGILFLDEINRGHEDIRQAMYQLITNKQIHTYRLPDNYTIVAAANPSTYEVYEFDKALTNRFAWVKVKPDVSETMDYLERVHGKSSVLSWVKNNTAVVEYGSEFEVEDLCYSPRSMESHIKLIEKLMTLEPEFKKKEFRNKCLQTIMPKETAHAYIAYLTELENISYEDILLGKEEKRLEKLVKDNRVDVLSTIVSDLADFFSEWEVGKTCKQYKLADEAKVIQNVSDFFSNMSAELGMLFLDSLKKHGFSNKNGITFHPVFRKSMKDKLGEVKDVFSDMQDTSTSKKK